MTDPGGERAAAAGSRGRLRASRADRERVVELLKVAFVQGRLTQDELDTRVGLALASRTYADLDDLIADIPAGPAAVEPAAEPACTPARTLARAARRSGICVLVAFAQAGIVALINSDSERLAGLAIFLGIVAVIAASGFLGYGVVDAWQERRSRGQLPPSRRDGRGLQGGRSGGTSRDPALPGARFDQTRPGQTRTALPSHRLGRDQRHLYGRCSGAPHGMRPVAGAV